MSHPPRRKRFGQHFLHDPAIIDRIAAAIHAGPADHLVEIGPGRGALTHRLLAARPATLDALEIDRDLAALLSGQLQGTPGFELHETDALKFDFAALAARRGATGSPAQNGPAGGGPAQNGPAGGGPARLRVVGNLPYNISTPLLFHLLAHGQVIQDLHIMLQREVIARMAAKAGDDDYGRLTVMLAPWVSIERLFDVGPGAFRPPPRVWSAVVRLTVRPVPAFEVSEHFAAVVAAAFAHRRKTLRNAVRGLLTQEQIESAGLDPGVRPETVAPEAFNALARKVVI